MDIHQQRDLTISLDIALIGDEQTGKSSLLRQFME